MVIDTSAIVAIFFNEPERSLFLEAIATDRRRLISAASLVEVQSVFHRASDEVGWAVVKEFLDLLGIETVDFTHEQAILGGEAYRRFGKGRHPAKLNLGDCMTYALAKHTGEPLLFKGNDFSQTDLLLA